MKLAESDKIWIKSVEWLKLIGKMDGKMTINKSDTRDIVLYEQDNVKFYIFHYVVNNTVHPSTALIPHDFIHDVLTTKDILEENEKYDKAMQDIWKIAFDKDAPMRVQLPQVEKIKRTEARKAKNARKKKRKNSKRK